MGKELPQTSPFADDDGSADPALASAAAGYAAAPDATAARTALSELVAALAGARVLVPVMAHVEALGDSGGLAVDTEASTGVVALQAPDGRTALPVFSSVATMARWRADARPVPTQTRLAALSAVEEGWELLVVDPGGPVSVQVPRTAVWALARGRDWEPAVELSPDGQARVTDAISSALIGAASGVTGVREVDVLPGTRAEVAVRLGIDAGLDRAELDAVLAGVNAAIAAESTVAARVDSLELRVHAVR